MDINGSASGSQPLSTGPAIPSVTLIPTVRRGNQRRASTASRRQHGTERLRMLRQRLSSTDEQLILRQDAESHRGHYAQLSENAQRDYYQERAVRRRARRGQARSQASSNRSLLLSTAAPGPVQLQGHEQDPIKALLLLHQASGSQNSVHAMSSVVNPEYDVHTDLVDAVKSIPVISDNDKSKLMDDYLAQMDKMQQLEACACCGVHCAPGSTESVEAVPFGDSRLDKLKLTSVELEDMRLRHDQYKQVMSITCDPGDPSVKYHLHPELCSSESAFICSICMTSLKQDQIPRFSIVSGCDFGLASRAKLPSLSLLEKSVISHFSIFGNVVKLILPGEAEASRVSRMVFTGHVIAFEKDGPRAMCNVFPNIDNASSSVSVKFLSPTGKSERMIQLGHQALRRSHLRVRVDVVYSWLYTLRNINPHYANLEIADDEETRRRLLNLPNEVLAAATVIADDSMIALERVADDVAAVRMTATDTTASAPDCKN